MSICWYCHWGWPKEVADIYRRGVEQSGEMEMDYGPAHVVWADENFDNDTIRHCIADALGYEGGGDTGQGYQRNHYIPYDYDQEHPELYTPPVGLEMVKL